MNGKKPNKEEKAWLDAICQYGCIVCRNEFGLFSPASPHHIDGSTKPGAHLKTIPLCYVHHQSGMNDENAVSRHPYKAAFEKRYGAEAELLARTHEVVGI